MHLEESARNRIDAFDKIVPAARNAIGSKQAKPILGLNPSKKRVLKLCESISQKTQREANGRDTEEMIRELNLIWATIGAAGFERAYPRFYRLFSPNQGRLSPLTLNIWTVEAFSRVKYRVLFPAFCYQILCSCTDQVSGAFKAVPSSIDDKIVM